MNYKPTRAEEENKNKYYETWFEFWIVSNNFWNYLGINMTEEMSAFEMNHKVKDTKGKRKHTGKKVKQIPPWFKYYVPFLAGMKLASSKVGNRTVRTTLENTNTSETE